MTFSEKLLLFLAFAAVIIGVFVWFDRVGTRRKEARARVWATGTPYEAIVAELRDTTGSINDHPHVDLVLDIEIDGETQRRTLRCYIQRLAVPRVQPGCRVAVRIDAEDTVALDPELAYEPWS